MEVLFYVSHYWICFLLKIFCHAPQRWHYLKAAVNRDKELKKKYL